MTKLSRRERWLQPGYDQHFVNGLIADDLDDCEQENGGLRRLLVAMLVSVTLASIAIGFSLALTGSLK